MLNYRRVYTYIYIEINIHIEIWDDLFNDPMGWCVVGPLALHGFATWETVAPSGSPLWGI
jgi:hypothetical protein